jgi:hypothetical protein
MGDLIELVALGDVLHCPVRLGRFCEGDPRRHDIGSAQAPIGRVLVPRHKGRIGRLLDEEVGGPAQEIRAVEILEASRMELHRTSSASQANSRCDLWRISPLSGPPVRRSNASSRPRSSTASVSVMTRIGKTQPSSRYCSIWVGVRRFVIDPRNSSGQGRTGSRPLPGQNDHGQPLPACAGMRGERVRQTKIATNPKTLGGVSSWSRPAKQDHQKFCLPSRTGSLIALSQWLQILGKITKVGGPLSPLCSRTFLGLRGCGRYALVFAQ